MRPKNETYNCSVLEDEESHEEEESTPPKKFEEQNISGIRGSFERDSRRDLGCEFLLLAVFFLPLYTLSSL